MTEHDSGAIAAAFSHHQFAVAYPVLAETVTWTFIGADVLRGKAAVIATADAAVASLVGTKVGFDAFQVHPATDGTVIVESVATYRTPDEASSVVASCDVYGFVEGQLTTITSYNIELPYPYDNRGQ